MANTDEYYFTVLRLVKEAGSVSGHLSQESFGAAGAQLVRSVSSYSWLIAGLRLSILHASDCNRAPTGQRRFLFRAGLRSASSAMYYLLQRECGIHSSSAMNFKFLDRAINSNEEPIDGDGLMTGGTFFAGCLVKIVLAVWILKGMVNRVN